jgi:heat shock protein HslJ
MKLRILGALLIAALALTAASTATAATFKLSSEGTVKLKAEGNQELAIENGGKVVCEKISGSVHVGPPLLTVSINLLITYSGKCEAFGSPVTITTGEILFNANGSVRIGRTDKFVITSAVGKCSIQILSENETTESLLGTVKYTNNASGTITGTATKLGVPTFTRGPGTVCGALGTAKGSYSGTAVSELEGGRISVEQ